jgi:hypothetical protein
MIVYRYIPPEIERLKAVCRRQHWMSLPGDFNDPFDCDHVVQTEGTTHEERLRLIEKMIERDVDDLLGHPQITEQLLKKDGADYFEKKMKSVGICCFSRCWRSIAMWSHYADSHRGICLGYETDSLVGRTGYLCDDVQYWKDPPDVHIRDVVDNFEEALHRYIFTKKKVWEYEKEWRLVRFFGGKGLMASPIRLQSITFGVRTNLRCMRKIYRALRKWDIKFYRVERVPETFNLKREPVTF